jgi:DNA-binding response OmpR family regulator
MTRLAQEVPVDKKVLIIGDDASARSELVETFVDEESWAWAMPPGRSDALLSTLAQADLIILDLPPSETDRWAVLQQIRQVSTLPVIALTTEDDYQSRIEGLDRGADFVMSKPIAVGELHARVRALVRRAQIRGRVAGRSRDLNTHLSASWPGLTRPNRTRKRQ